LTEFIKKKGGIEILNNLPNSLDYKTTHGRNDFDDYLTYRANGGKPGDTGSELAQASIFGNSTAKKVIRGTGASTSFSAAKPTVIRGGAHRA
jgi:hypothetical protein